MKIQGAMERSAKLGVTAKGIHESESMIQARENRGEALAKNNSAARSKAGGGEKGGSKGNTAEGGRVGRKRELLCS